MTKTAKMSEIANKRVKIANERATHAALLYQLDIVCDVYLSYYIDDSSKRYYAKCLPISNSKKE